MRIEFASDNDVNMLQNSVLKY